MKDRSLWIILALLFAGTAAGAVFDYFASHQMLAPLRESSQPVEPDPRVEAGDGDEDADDAQGAPADDAARSGEGEHAPESDGEAHR